MAHPVIAALPCSECIEFGYDSTGHCGTRLGERHKRPPGMPPPCTTCPKIPPGAPPRPDSAVELTPANRECWDHYLECRAVGWQVPEANDPLVRRHAALIREIEDLVSRGDMTDNLIQLGRMLRRSRDGK